MLARPLKSTGKPAPRFILNVVCTAVAYFSMHAHPYWPSLISDLTVSLSESDDPALAIYGKSNMDLGVGSESTMSVTEKVERQNLSM